MLMRDRAMHHFSITEGHLEVRTHRSAQVLQSTQEDKGGTVSASKMDEVVCAHNFFKRKGAKPILQATVASLAATSHRALRLCSCDHVVKCGRAVSQARTTPAPPSLRKRSGTQQHCTRILISSSRRADFHRVVKYSRVVPVHWQPRYAHQDRRQLPCPALRLGLSLASFQA
jgi:hypothetical protein